jgi:HD-like signal output (HDOD) protein
MSTPAPAIPDPRLDAKTAPFEFVKNLAAELSRGKIDLPSVPDVAIRVRMVLADENSTIDQVVRVTSSEPVLAANLLRMANSVAFNPGGRAVSDLRTAINRMGYDIVRSATISFALEQIRRSEALKSIRPKLDELWEQSTHVAAISCVLARRLTTRNPDEALLTGLLHNIGKLYILTRIVHYPPLFRDAESLAAINRNWHANVGTAILENWGLPEEVCQAVHDHEDTTRIHRGAADLTDLVTGAVAIAELSKAPDGLSLVLPNVGAIITLGLTPESCESVVADMQEEIDALRQALSA